MSLFPTRSSFSFQPIAMDLSVLASRTAATADAALTAKLVRASKNFTTPSVEAPWQDGTTPGSLNSRVALARGQTSFINPRAPEVVRAGSDDDLRTTFTLYRALDRLRTLAEYAADSKTAGSARAEANAAFRRGLAEVEAFVASSPGEKTTFQFGDKTSRLKPPVTIGKANTTYTGRPVQTGERADALAGVTGTESFALTLSKTGSTDTFTIDLATISGPITLDAVAEAINTQIKAMVLTDGNGNPLLDSNGDPLTRYQTRAAVVRDEKTGDWGLSIRATLLEKASLAEIAPAPAVYVAASRTNALKAAPVTAELMRFDVAAEPSLDLRQSVAGFDANATSLAARVYAANKPKATDPLAFTPPPPGDIAAPTTINALAVDSQGNVYSVGTTSGDLDGQQGSGRADLFLTKRDSQGQVIFSRLLGAAGTASGMAIAIDASDNVIVAGQTDGKVSATDTFTGADTLVMKFDPEGRELFAVQLDSFGADGAQAVAVNSDGDIFVAGKASGAVRNGLTALGGSDAYIMKLSGASGSVLSARQYGSASSDEATGIAVDSNNTIIVTSMENGSGFVRRFDADDLSVQLGARNIGDLAGGRLNGVAIDPANRAVIAVGATRSGSLAAAQVNGSYSGETDGFMMRLGTGLGVQRLTYVGTGAADGLTSVAAVNGTVYAVGSTGGDLARPRSGPTDSILVTMNRQSGLVLSTTQLGTPGQKSAATAVAFASKGSGVLASLGLRTGNLNPDPPQTLVDATALRPGDHFFVAIDGGRARKITIEARDTFQTLATKMKAGAAGAFDIQVSSTSTGTSFEIKPKGERVIDLTPGKTGQDALAKLGVGPTRVVDAARLFGIEQDEEEEGVSKPGGYFGLSLNADLAIGDATSAAYTKKILDNAVGTTQRAYRSLYFDPIKAQLLSQKSYGPAPAYLTKQLAGYQDALARLQGGSGGGFTL